MISAEHLDHDILSRIDQWHRHGHMIDDVAFDRLAREIWAFQCAHNVPYAAYCAALRVDDARPPASWREIPAVPTAAYKESTFATFDVENAALAFVTSGTTRGIGGRHYMQTAALYDAALLATFDHFMLADGAKLRYLNLVPNPHERSDSSLGYMMAHISAHRGSPETTGWYVRGDAFLIDALFADIDDAIAQQQPVCIATTAFALVLALDTMEREKRTFTLPAGSRIMETGGFKGRTQIVNRTELYARACTAFGIGDEQVIAEYGMTELTSQYYDLARPAITLQSGTHYRVKGAPPWMRPRVVDHEGRDLPDGTIGALVHVDCANRSSCVAVLTEDLGAIVDGNLVLLGREEGAHLRGCSLDAENLRPS